MDTRDGRKMGLINDNYQCPVCREWGGGCGCLKEYEREGYEPERVKPDRTGARVDRRLRQRDCE